MAENGSENIIVIIIHMHACTLVENSSTSQVCAFCLFVLFFVFVFVFNNTITSATGVKVPPKPAERHECKFSILNIIQLIKYSAHFG